MNTCSTLVLSLTLFAGLATSPALAQPAGHDHQQHAPAKTEAPQDGKDQKPEKAAVDKRVGDPYPLTTCPITGEKLGSMGEPVVKLYEGREVRFCCKSCPPKFEKDLAKSLETLDAAIIKDQGPIYPLTTSVVTGKDLPATPSKPYDFVYGNRLIRLGAESEKADFLKDPKKYLAKLDDAAIAAQDKDYPLKTCPVSKEDLGGMGEPVNVVVAGRLVRLCCNGCKKDLMKDPLKYIASVDAAKKDKPASPAADAPHKEGGHDHGK
ncbi:MAG: hypothetical protein JSS51_13235 [Planctomycetes bacterium]|nr:hypothetical protein [Planctomycetota bacterium]